jgi:YVTN family beta-propeller protein
LRKKINSSNLNVRFPLASLKLSSFTAPNKQFMKYLASLLFIPLLFFACQKKTDQTTMTTLSAQRVTLPNGWSLTPAGRSLPLGDLPLNLVVSPSKKLMAVTHNGQSKQTIALLGIDSLLSEIEVKTAWYGLAFSQDETKLYASGGNQNRIWVYSTANKQLALADSLVLGDPWPKQKIGVTGLALDEANQRLFAVTKEDSSLYVLGLADKKIAQKIKLPAEAYTCALAPGGAELWVSIWGGAKMLVLATKDLKVMAEVATDSHPSDFVFTQKGDFVFVANGNDNTVSVIDTKQLKTVETLTTSLFPNAPLGSTPNAVALSEDNKTLLVANADNNCLAVFDVAQPGNSQSRGFIPTGWYPTSVKVIGKQIFVTNGKGNTSLANPQGPTPYKKRDENTQYIGGMLKGSLSVIAMPDAATLAEYTKLAYENTPYTKEKETTSDGEAGNPIPKKVGEASPIKYVFYIIKENRTYDQVFGDVPGGNGDTSLCLFPERVTPNHHALAKQFVLLDNFYVDAEVSADGHNWSMAAYANDYVEKNWPTSYGGRGGTYDYEGSRAIAYPKNGFIWDFCQRANVSYRTYGEFADDGKANLPALVGHFDQDYPGYDLSIKDQVRFEKWRQDFDSLVKINAVPRFNTIRFGNDHTAGTRLGMPTPHAMVADNDLALGKFVEHLSNSPIWKESAVFVLEDDAQNGPDHVDAHRSPALVISPYVKRKQIDHTMYSTSGMLRTMELILGLPPMSQYDAAATPMWRCFTSQPDLSPYKALASNINLDEMNIALTPSAKKSALFNLKDVDAAPDLAFSEVIWKGVKGENAVMPAPRRGAFIRPIEKEKEEGEK